MNCATVLVQAAAEAKHVKLTALSAPAMFLQETGSQGIIYKTIPALKQSVITNEMVENRPGFPLSTLINFGPVFQGCLCCQKSDACLPRKLKPAYSMLVCIARLGCCQLMVTPRLCPLYQANQALTLVNIANARGTQLQMCSLAVEPLKITASKQLTC